MTGRVPKGWRRVELSDCVASIEAGVSVNSEDTPAQVGEAGILKTSCVATGIFCPKENKRVLSQEFYRLTTSVKAGSIIVSRMNTPDLVGASAYVSMDEPNLFLPDRLWAVMCNDETNPRWLGHILSGDQMRNALKTASSGTSGSMKNLAQGSFLKIEITRPPLDEQRRIVAMLAVTDRVGELQGRLLQKKKYVLDGLRERLLRKSRKSKRTSLGVLTIESTSRNRDVLNRGSVMAVTKESGLRPMRVETIAADISRYKVVRPNAFAYNPMRLNIGSIARSYFDDDVLVSPDYVVFECNKRRLLPAYIDHLRYTRKWASFFGRAGDGGVRVRIYYDDLARFIVDLPPVDEQKKIVRLLNAAQREVELLEQKCVALEKLKRGLMQLLLTGKKRLLRDLPGMEVAA